jgi:hypothetical protein
MSGLNLNALLQHVVLLRENGSVSDEQIDELWNRLIIRDLLLKEFRNKKRLGPAAPPNMLDRLKRLARNAHMDVLEQIRLILLGPNES